MVQEQGLNSPLLLGEPYRAYTLSIRAKNFANNLPVVPVAPFYWRASGARAYLSDLFRRTFQVYSH